TSSFVRKYDSAAAGSSICSPARVELSAKIRTSFPRSLNTRRIARTSLLTASAGVSVGVTIATRLIGDWTVQSTTVGVALRGHPCVENRMPLYGRTGGHGGPPLQLWRK